MVRMNDYYQNRRGLLIADTRTGATMLSHLLDSHPQIFCTRGEVLHSKDATRRLSASPSDAIGHALSMTGYQVNIAKMTYQQWLEVFDYKIDGLGIDFIIHLKRRNLLRAVLSNEVRKKNKLTHTHSYKTPAREAIEVDAVGVMWQVLAREQLQSSIVRKIAELDIRTMTIHSEYLTRNLFKLADGFKLSEIACDKLCQVADVPLRMMTTNTEPINPHSIGELVENHQALIDVFYNTSYEWMLG